MVEQKIEYRLERTNRFNTERTHAENEMDRRVNDGTSIPIDLLVEHLKLANNGIAEFANGTMIGCYGYGYRYGDYFTPEGRLTYYDGVRQTIENLLHTLRSYGGFNSRNWFAFCSIDGWHPLVMAMHNYDDDNRFLSYNQGGRKGLYWRMLDALDRRYTRGHHPIHFYGALSPPPNRDEMRNAQRIFNACRSMMVKRGYLCKNGEYAPGPD